MFDSNSFVISEENKKNQILGLFDTTYPVTITTTASLPGITFLSVCHHYYWSIFNDPIVKNRILNEKNPKMALEIANKYSHLAKPHDPATEMKRILIIKKNNIIYFRNLLDSTNKKLIIYRSSHPVWGDADDGTGRNLYGLCLMDIR